MKKQKKLLGDKMDNIIEKLKKLNVGKVEEDVSLAKYNTFHVGGKALGIVFPRNEESLVILVRFLRENDIKYKIFGFGSNLVCSNNYYNGIIIRLDELNNIKFYKTGKVKVGAGYSLIKLTMQVAKRDLTGLEFASGIPGTVGGAVYMNAGAYKSDMGYVVERVKVLTPDLNIIYLENKEMNFHYRSSFLQTHKDYICLEVIIKLRKGSREAIEDLMRERRQRRVESQPLEYPSAGSVFRNPEGNFAGKLIEDSGLKGKIKGGAMISDKHANFIINKDNASSEDVKYLIDLCHDTILKKYNIDMKVEQEFFNWE